MLSGTDPIGEWQWPLKALYSPFLLPITIQSKNVHKILEILFHSLLYKLQQCWFWSSLNIVYASERFSPLVLLLKQPVMCIFFFLPQCTRALACSVFPHLALSPDTLTCQSDKPLHSTTWTRFFPLCSKLKSVATSVMENCLLHLGRS